MMAETLEYILGQPFSPLWYLLDEYYAVMENLEDAGVDTDCLTAPCLDAIYYRLDKLGLGALKDEAEYIVGEMWHLALRRQDFRPPYLFVLALPDEIDRTVEKIGRKLDHYYVTKTGEFMAIHAAKTMIIVADTRTYCEIATLDGETGQLCAAATLPENKWRILALQAAGIQITNIDAVISDFLAMPADTVVGDFYPSDRLLPRTRGLHFIWRLFGSWLPIYIVTISAAIGTQTSIARDYSQLIKDSIGPAPAVFLATLFYLCSFICIAAIANKLWLWKEGV